MYQDLTNLESTVTELGAIAYGWDENGNGIMEPLEYAASVQKCEQIRRVNMEYKFIPEREFDELTHAVECLLTKRQLLQQGRFVDYMIGV